MDWLDLLAVQGTLKSLLQHHSSKASILWCSALFTVHLLHPYMTTGKTIALTRWNLVGKVMSLLFNMLSRFIIAFFPRSKHLWISWLQSLSAVILEPKKMKSVISIGMWVNSLIQYQFITTLNSNQPGGWDSHCVMLEPAQTSSYWLPRANSLSGFLIQLQWRQF